MDEYITGFSYDNYEKICFGISLEKNNINNVYEYHLKFNTTINYDEMNLPDLPANENITRVDQLNK